MALAPHELPEFKKPDLFHLDARVGFDPPEQIGTSPRGQPMPLGSVPQKADLVTHRGIISAEHIVRLALPRPVKHERKHLICTNQQTVLRIFA
jgi:hypothetical protein